MASISMNETEDLVTCSVCLYEFDVGTRKPKFLPCAHTLCLHCLRAIQKNGSITCPLCRKVSEMVDVSLLPNNLYALCILNMKAKEADAPSTVLGPSWCLTCGSVSRVNCYGNHSTVHMKADKLINLKPLVDLKREIKKMKELRQSKLSQAMAKHKEVQTYYTQVLKALKSMESEVKEAEEENNMALAEIVCLLNGDFSTLEQDKMENSLSELFSLVENSRTDDTLEALKLNVKKSLQVSEEKLKLSETHAQKIEQQMQTKISLKLSGEMVNSTMINSKVLTWLENGFRVNVNPSDSSESNRDLLLFSNTIFTILRKSSLNFGGQIPNSSSDIIRDLPSTSSFIGGAEKTLETYRPLIFIVSVFLSGVLKGRFHIESSKFYYDQSFIGQFHRHCMNSPQPLIYEKAVAGDFAVLSLINNRLAPTMHAPVTNDAAAKQKADCQKARSTSDVGFLFNAVTGKSELVFALKQLDDQKHLVIAHKEAPLFGRIVQGMDLLTTLSAVAANERRFYNLTLSVA